MKTPRLAAVIERRLLVNLRADADVAARLLPDGLRPQLVGGSAVVGICCIRLGHVRPVGAPSAVGLRSESAAHRIAVEWDDPGGRRHGVYIARRDSGSRMNVLAGGRLFPGVHHRARFESDDAADHVDVRYLSDDGAIAVDLRTRTGGALGSRLFPDLADASAFFESGSVGLSPSRRGGLEAMRLSTNAWCVEPVELMRMRSTWLDDPTRFPPGSVEPDCALVMRQVPVTWARASAP